MFQYIANIVTLCCAILNYRSFFEVAIILHVQYIMLYCNISQVAICMSITMLQYCYVSPKMNNTNSTILCISVYSNEKVTTNAALTLPYVL